MRRYVLGESPEELRSVQMSCGSERRAHRPSHMRSGVFMAPFRLVFEVGVGALGAALAFIT